MSAYKLILILLGIIDLGHLKLFFSQAEFLGTHQVLYLLSFRSRTSKLPQNGVTVCLPRSPPSFKYLSFSLFPTPLTSGLKKRLFVVTPYLGPVF
jgi:hypothetical protein